MDANRDISRLVDPGGAGLHLSRGLYLREPQDKPMLQTEDLEFSVSQHPAEELLPLLRELGPDGSAVAGRCLSPATRRCCCTAAARPAFWGPLPSGVWTLRCCSPG